MTNRYCTNCHQLFNLLQRNKNVIGT